MPAMMKCPTCEKYEGPHGFNDPGVGGIMRFYHTTTEGVCYSFYADNQWFKTEADAWKQVRPRLAADQRRRDGVEDTLWLEAFDALILEKDEKKHKRLIKRWSNRYH